MDIGKRIKKYREENMLTQTQLADKLGYTSKAAISRLENAGNHIGTSTIVKVADALNVKPSDLMGWTDVEAYSDGTFFHKSDDGTIYVYSADLDEEIARSFAEKELSSNNVLDYELMSYFSQLNEENCRKVISYAEKLIKLQDAENKVKKAQEEVEKLKAEINGE